MKNKILMITAALAVMMAMTGIAAAYDMNINKDPFDISSGTDSSTITLTFMNAGSQYITGTTNNPLIKVCIAVKPSLEAACDDITKIGLTTTGWSNAASPPSASSPNFKYTTLKADSQTPFDIYVKGTANGIIASSINQGTVFDVSGLTIKYADSTADANIPEFPTVALPVAAVIGLVFLFSNRKKKEE